MKSKDFIEKSMRFLPQNPRLKLLQGLLYADAADMQAVSGKYSVAEELHGKAPTFGENHIIFKKRGENSCRQEKYQEALNDLNHAIGLYPEDSDYYYWRSKAYGKLEELDNTATDILRATDLDP